MRLPSLRLRSLRSRMIVQVLSVAALAVAVMTVISVARSSSDQKRAIFGRAAETAQHYANQVDADFQRRQALGREIAETMDAYSSNDREEVSAILHHLLLRNPTVAGTYVGFDAGAFDGRDRQFAGTGPTTDKSGRFIPYWNRLAGKVALEPLLDMDTSDYYVLPKKLRRDNPGTGLGPGKVFFMPPSFSED